MEIVKSWAHDLQKSLEKLGVVGSDSLESVTFQINQTWASSENDNIGNGDKIKDSVPHDIKDWEYPQLRENNEDYEDYEGDIDMPEDYDTTDYTNDKELDSICKPYMDKAKDWAKSLLENVNKKEVWKHSDSEIINSMYFAVKN